MLDWILNPEGVQYSAYVFLWVMLIVFIPVAIVVTALRVFWDWRERKDGKK